MSSIAAAARFLPPERVAQVHAVLEGVVAVLSIWLRSPMTWEEPFHRESHEPLHRLSAVFELSGRAAGIVVLSLDRGPARFAAEQLTGERLSDLPDMIAPVETLARMVAAEAAAPLRRLQTRIRSTEVVVGRSRCLAFPPAATPLCIPFETSHGPLAVEFGLDD